MSDDYNTATPHTLSISDQTPPALSLAALLESLLFVADGPVPLAQFAQALDATPRAIEAALEELDVHYQQRGLRIQREKSGVQLTTAPQSAQAVEKFLGLESLQRLSKPAVETLAIIAYQQPVTRPYIESIRGVNSDGVIKSLLTKGLIEEVGRTEGPGRPVLYATTSTFLQHFGLAALTELPPLDIESLLAAAKVTAEQDLITSPAAGSISATDPVETSNTLEDDHTASESQPADSTQPLSDSDPDLANGRGDLVPAAGPNADSEPELADNQTDVSFLLNDSANGDHTPDEPIDSRPPDDADEDDDEEDDDDWGDDDEEDDDDEDDD